MIVATSAVVAVLMEEPEAERFTQAIAQSVNTRMSAGTYLETAIVIDSNRNPILTRRLDQWLATLEVAIEPVTVEHARIARLAYRDFGRGSGHTAKLNFGDCFAYALASATGEPLLFKGEDFVATDLLSALDATP